ncbi:MAG: hypothetical protein OXE82_14035 [Rhodobacter sp.]|nr:hypothetical protein [Rhodobacter sp.]
MSGLIVRVDDWVPCGDLDKRYVRATRPGNGWRRNRPNFREFLNQVKLVDGVVNEVIDIPERAKDVDKMLAAILKLPGVACRTENRSALVSTHATARDLRQSVERFVADPRVSPMVIRSGLGPSAPVPASRDRQ